jgi:tetratricopeptide (TPR) repeat protein
MMTPTKQVDRLAARLAVVLLPAVLILGGCALTSSDMPPAQAAKEVPSTPVATSAPVTLAPAASTSVRPTPAATSSAAPMPMVQAPADAQRQFDQALALLKSGQIPAATTQLQQLASAYPTLVGPLVNLGLIEIKANHFEAASAYFKQAVERDAKSAVANNYLGVSYRNLGRFNDAERAYKAAIAADDSYAAAHLNLGVLYDLYLQKPEASLSEYQRYQDLLSAPDIKVAGWIKELTGRINAENKKAKPSTSEAAP